MDEKIKQICKIHFWFFCTVSCAFGLKVCKNCIMTQQIFFPNIFNIGIKKCRIWCWFGIRWKSSKKCTWRKLHGWELLYTVLKVEKVLARFYASNFFGRNLFTLFSTDLKSASNSAFIDTHFKMLWKKYFLGHISTFCQLWSLTWTERLKKSKNLFFLTWIRINYIFQFWFRTNKVLKSFHPNRQPHALADFIPTK